jgi:hypothetical protein
VEKVSDVILSEKLRGTLRVAHGGIEINDRVVGARRADPVVDRLAHRLPLR